MSSYEPIPKRGSSVPFGYEQVDGSKLLMPIEGELEALSRAKDFLAISPIRDVTAWIEHETGRSISHQGLVKRMKRGVAL